MFPLLYAVMFTLCIVSKADISTATCCYVYIGLVSIADVSTTTCCYVYIGLVSIADVSTATCCYVYIVSSKHIRCFHCYIL